jgi:2-polyprenyl-3-methyl-5-hydroxy-6-metoxy-1,4-benzoquinol methylase
MTMPERQGETAVARHDRMVREEKEQADAVATQLAPSDFWQGMAGRFRPRTEQGDDPTLAFLLPLLQVDDRVIDVGAGGGRLALPLAAHCREVIAVEPSAAMRTVLDEACQRLVLTNVVVIPETWEQADVGSADVVLSANVTYGMLAIEPFLRKIDAVATRHAVVIANVEPPQAPMAPFWQAVYGEERLRLPCSTEVVDVLRELGAEPQVTPLPPLPAQAFGTREETLTELRRRLFVAPGTVADDRLQHAVSSLTEEREGVLWPLNAHPRERHLIVWKPGSFRR